MVRFVAPIFNDRFYPYLCDWKNINAGFFLDQLNEKKFSNNPITTFRTRDNIVIFCKSRGD